MNIRLAVANTNLEVYIGDGKSLASRNGIGVACYNLRTEQLIAVLRPLGIMDLDAGRKWFYSSANGQGYDWKGLLCFTLAVKQGSPRKMFCSEIATRFDRACGMKPFNPNFDADKIAPGSFFMSPAFETVYLHSGIRI